MRSSPRVVVLGAGISGLTSALALLESGYRDVRVVAERVEGLVSHVAGAIWMPFALPADVSPHKPRCVNVRSLSLSLSISISLNAQGKADLRVLHAAAASGAR